MKLVPIEQARNELADTIAQAQTDQVIITRHGKAVAILLGAAAAEALLLGHELRPAETPPKRRKGRV
jgi:prevent-host-death family protein